MAKRKPIFLFAPGAGAPSTSPWMEAWASRLSALGHVVRFDYGYRKAGRKLPDRLPKLIEAHAEALAEARAGHPESTILVGKSMGGRVGCHLSLEPDAEVTALVCLGYPLKSPGRAGTLRDQVLLDLRTPVLFCQGTRDRLCPLDLLEEVRSRMAAPSSLRVVEDGDHSLELTVRYRKRTGTTQGDSDRAVLEAIGGFLRELETSRG